MWGKLLSSRSSTLKRGFSCLIRFASSSRASVSVAVVTNSIAAVAWIIRAIRLVCPAVFVYEATRFFSVRALPT